MTNYEKYMDLVLRCIVKEACVCDLAHKAYGTNPCDKITCEECCEFTAEWLKSEYSEIDWSKVEVDTPVFIDSEEGIICRHFAGYWHGHVFVYANGLTSWTNDGKAQAWEPECVKFGRDEDSKKYAKQ